MIAAHEAVAPINNEDAMSQCPYIIDVQAENFDVLVLQNSHKIPVLVDFWATWCNPCQTLIPMLHKLAEEMNGQFLLAKVNSDEQQALTAQYGVRSLPTVKLFKNGEVVDEFMGALPESAIREFLDKYIERESDRMAQQALAMAEVGQLDEALDLLQQACDSDPENYRIKLEHARLLASSGQHQAASDLLKKFPIDKLHNPEVSGLLTQLEFAMASIDAPDLNELLTQLAADENNSEARFQLALQYIGQGQYEEGMQQLLELMKRDRNYKDGAPQKTLLMVFETLGGSGPLVSKYRSQLYNLLY